MKQAQKFKRKIFEVEAFQFNQDSDAGFLHSWTEGNFNLVAPEDREDDPTIVAEVMNGMHNTWVGVHYGDWIIKGSRDDFYPCEAKKFQELYESV